MPINDDHYNSFIENHSTLIIPDIGNRKRFLLVCVIHINTMQLNTFYGQRKGKTEYHPIVTQKKNKKTKQG